MSSPTGTGKTVLGPGQWAAWVNEHGAHLLDYAAYHLGPDRAVRAVAAAFTACGTRTVPGGVSVRAWLLAVLRRDCFTRPGHRDGYAPGAGPGLPDPALLERAWALADPLGTETLRLMFRHELTSEDLSHVLALPREEVDRLATRTQDTVETLVSALDGLAHGRSSCPALRPLAEAAFPGGLHEPGGPSGTGGVREAEGAGGAGGGRGPAGGGSGEAGRALLAHIVRCPTCARPINIRYTVPQMSSHPPVAPLTTEARGLLLASLPPAAGRPAQEAPATVALPVPRRGTAPYAAPAGGPVRAAPARRPPGPPAPGPSAGSTEPPTRVSPRPAGAGPYPPPAPRTGPVPLPAPVRPPGLAPPPGPGHGTPLYDALLSQVMARTGPALDVPETIPDAAPSGTARPPARRDGGAGLRLPEALRWAGARFRSTTLRIVIIVAAGTAGTLTGMNLLGPATGIGSPAENGIPSARPQAATTAAPGPTAPGPAAAPGPTAPAGPPAGEPGGTGEPGVSGDPGEGGESTLASRVLLPAEVTLDAYGQGTLTLTSAPAASTSATASQEPLTWRLSAPGLVASPSEGTLGRGDTAVVTLRALRVRHWCGPAPAVSAPLTLHGPDDDSISTTVRWRTC
ncbi:hypothetical protein ACFOWE_02550 [Planomonospora corallina]|uniref:DNA-directed RNA polymerase specialized sigma subunit, sigma24 family n=1 Tax=Planomonospora corallina TaxID=1806052 RepID=A0ABV8HZZ3_9ACTN